ncbi:MAG: glucose 1-dehydrogenase [Candidatus Eisenbacteria bacterium]|nr:glucose 1-dehydrogenase [Candidatus Latescibacterota bacterium]MBD3303289.1 glucose 1-dehydrogenase [Candidatus Eisenbacteria bacterium]
MITLEGKVALVTGGSRGIGAACCRLLAQAGCDVAINYRRRTDAALAVAAEVERAGRRALPVGADVIDPMRVEAMVGRVVEELGGIDLLINNAGIWTDGSIETLTDADWARMIGVNLSGVFHLCRSVVPAMKRRGGGAIVNVVSTAGQRGEAHHGHYAASKGGAIALTKSLAVELAPHGIRVNAVAPGWIRTDMTEPFLTPERIDESLKEPIPLGRPGEPEDVAGPVVFLCSPLARHVTGATLNVNGGAVLT